MPDFVINNTTMTEQGTANSLILEEWITPNEAAELLDITPHQVRHLARMGTLESKKFGHAWMVKRASVEDYQATERRPGPKSQA